jgi:sugar phosphate isomerase/epimerase
MISLAQWSLHRMLEAGELSNAEFPAKAKAMGIYAVEYVSRFFEGGETDTKYMNDQNSRCADLGVKQLLIMVDDEGDLGDTNETRRQEAVKNHHKWVEAAKHLGCHSIRVNAFGRGTPDEVKAAAIDGLGNLSTFAKPRGINIIVENHGSYSSDGKWLTDVISQVGMDNCGTLPDFGNFCIRRNPGGQGEDKCVDEYDRYLGVGEMMPFAKAVSAKSYDFDNDGNETTIDYKRMMDIIKASGYSGYLGIEYEGSRLSEEEGIMATKKLLERYI